MTQIKKPARELAKALALSGLAALALTGVAGQAFAIENGTFTNYVPGALIGFGGAQPPPGLYTGLETANLIPSSGVGNQGLGALGKYSVGANVAVVPVVWETGLNFFGGQLGFTALQPFYNASINSGSPGNGCAWVGGPIGLGSTVCDSSYVVGNTTWAADLGWKLGGGWFTSLGIGFQAPDGSQYKTALGATSGIINTNPDYWSVEPTFGLSYIGGGWNLSGRFQYFFNGASAGNTSLVPAVNAAAANGWTNGQEFYSDLAAIYSIGKWQLGPVAYIAAQTTNDSPGGGQTCAAAAAISSLSACGKQLNVGLGGLIGYDFGPVSAQVWLTDSVVHQDSNVNGVGVWSRLLFKLWGPDAGKPLVAKN